MVVDGRKVSYALAGVLSMCIALFGGAAKAQFRRVDLKVLVLSAGDVGTAMIKAGLDEGMVPYTEIDLTATNRPAITAAFLAETSLLTRRAKFQAIVLPNEAPVGLSTAERTALTNFQREYKIRQVDAYVYPSPAVHMNWPVSPAYLGPLDGMVGSVSVTAKTAGFGYLNGPVPFENIDASVPETYGYLSTPLPADAVNRRSFVPFVTMTIPETNVAGVLVGVYNDNGREELIVTSSMNQFQLQQHLLVPGIIEWMTYGVHLGTARNYLAVHIDDVFLADARWSTGGNCTVGDDCPENVTAPDILMTPADVDYLLAWQTRQGLKLDMVFNGAGYDQTIAQAGSFPLGARLLQSRAQLRWISHTYTHAYLGCIQDFSVSPWRCATDARGQIRWLPYADVYNELNRNLTFASQRGLSIARGELVTGEHSGLRRTPQEPSDNPNLARAISALRLEWVGSDNSRESVQRTIGSARTVPRYPMNIFYNVGTKAEEVDEYNWIYTSRANGGSGLCENNPSSTCIAPLTAEGFDSYIVPLEARIALLHVVSNSPRPHYAHQSNLAEDRILYPVLDRAIETYRQVFAANTPLVNMTTTDAGNEFVNRTTYQANKSRITAYVQNGDLVVTAAGLLTTYRVPITVPSGSSGASSLTSYAGGRSGWQPVVAPFLVNVDLPSNVGYAR